MLQTAADVPDKGALGFNGQIPFSTVRSLRVMGLVTKTRHILHVNGRGGIYTAPLANQLNSAEKNVLLS